MISEITVGSGTDALTPKPNAGTGALVDVLAQAPVLNAVNATDPVLEAPSTSDQAAPATDNTSANGTGLDSDMQPELMAAAGVRELVFVNENIADYQQLIADLQGGNDNRFIEVVVLDADRDGIEQVSEIMADRSDLAAVHFITHGTDGQINLGNTWLNRVTLQQNRAAVTGWGDALSETGDIIFYGCNVAADSAGQLLLNDIADFTGADVAASNDLTGNTTSGGDWEMEYTNGEIDTDVAFSPDARQHWSGVLATFNVTTTTDGGAGSLRKAIIDANALPGADTIILPAGTYQLSLNGDKEDAAASGDLDITDDLIISGAGAKATFIDGMAADRVFEVLGSTVTISGITIQNGSEDDGGGINLDSSSNLTLRDAAVSGNHATDTGGGIGVSGVLTIECVTIEGNSADVGGGIYLNNGSSATLLNATLSGNSAAHDGGAIYTKSVADITNSTIAYNTAGGAGGIHKQGSGNASLKNTILADNTGGNSNGALISLGNNIDSQNTAGLDMLLGDQVMTDPLLGGLVYNGGPTKTHALLSGSPAIDAGTSSGAPAFDQRGYARDLTPDIGAFEFSAAAGPPVAVNDAAVTTENTPVIIDVIANDVDAEGDPLSVFDYTLPANGSLVDNGDGTITYTPNSAFTGNDNFEYVVTDGNDGTSHYWKLDGDGVDSVGSNDATTITGTATMVGHYGSALRFDEFDDKVVIPDFSYASDFTVSLRFRVDDNTGSAFQYIYSHGVADAPQSLNIYIGENLCAYPNMLLTNLRDANDNMDGTALNVDLAALGIIGDGQWHLYTLTVTAGVGSEVFIDGVSRSSSARGKDAFSPGGTDLYLGARNDLDADRFYGGGLDSVQIFDRALNGPEINALHTGGVSRATVDVTVVSNISPSIAGTTTGQAVDDNATVMPFSTVTIADDGNVGITVTLSDGDDNGSFTAASLTASGFTKTDVGEYSLGSTTPAAAQTAIRLLVFDPTENQVAPGATVTTTFTIDVDDGFLSSADSTTTVIATSINFAPTADPGGPYTISEGDALNLDASASDDPDGTIVSWDWDIGDNGSFEKSGKTVSYSWAELNAAGVIDDGSVDVTLRVTDNDGAQTFQTFQVTVDNTAPTLAVSGDTTVDDGALYTLNLSANDPGNDAITSWTINWGDGTIETIPGNQSSATHIYSNSGFTYSILVSATDEDSTTNYIHNDLFAGHYINDAGVYRIQGDWGAAPVEFANEGTLDKTIQPIVGPDGNLYVSGESSKNVLRYNTETGAFIDVFANIPGDAGGIAFGPDGNLYVADYTNGQILRFSGSDGSAMGAFATGIGGRPYSLAFGPDGNLYVALYDNAEVLKYDGLSGTALGTFISAPAGGIGTPEQIVFGPDGNLYIADFDNNSVLRFNGADGTPMGDFVAGSEPHLDEPNGLAFGPDGNLYVSDSQHGVILRFDGSTGAFIDVYASGLDAPSLLAFAPDLQVHVTANTPPTLSSFIAPVTSGDEDSEIMVTFGDLAAQGDENDADGTVDAFVVKAVTSGTLRIGADAGSATAWVADSNDTLNATTHAYWTPDPHANGTLNAFAVVAEDNAGAESITPVTATVAVAANPVVNDQSFSVDENALSGTPVGTLAATACDPAHNYSKLYWVDVDTDELRRIELDGTLNQTLADQADITAATGPRSVTVDDVNGHVYWTNNNSSEIWRANLDGSSAAPVLTGLVSPIGIAVDPFGKKIYWFDAAANELWRADIDGSNAAALITTDISNPKALAIDASGGKLYWTNNGSSPGLGEIKRADLDGSNIETVTSGLDNPHSIALDTVRGKIYWAETDLQEIHRADMAAGVGSETVVIGLGAPRAVAVDSLRGKLYWADAGTDRIERANLDGSSIEFLTGTGQWPLSIALGPPVQNLTYAITGGNTNGAFALDPVTGEITVANSTELDFENTPVFNLAVTVTDAGGHSDNATITVDLNNLNDNNPVADAESFTVAEGGTATEADLDAGTSLLDGDTDADLPNDTLTVTTTPVSGPSHASSFILNADGTFSYTHDGSENLSDSFTYEVTDALGHSSTAVVTITITPVNDSPVLGNNNLIITEGATVIFDSTMLSATDVDNSDPGLTFNISGVTGGHFERVSTGMNMTVFTQNDITSGEVQFVQDGGETAPTYSVSVTDGTNSTPAVPANITFINQNDTPTVANAIPDQSATEDAAFSFTFAANTFSDVDAGDSLTYSASGLPGWLTFNAGTRTFSGTPANSDVGVVTVTVRATDTGGAWVEDQFDITVANVNDAPTVVNAIPDQSATEDAAFSFHFASNTFSDVDAGDSLTYTASGLPGWLTFNAGTRTFSGTPANSDVGVVTVTVRATDTGGAWVGDQFDITVANVNDAPTVANAIPDQSATEDAAFSFTFAANTFSDVDAGDSLTYTASGLPGWLTFNAGTRTFSGTPANSDVGVVTVTVRATDTGGAWVEDQFDITVANVNDAPTVANAIPDQSATEDAAFSFQFASNTFSDVDAGDSLTYSASGLPGWLSFNAGTRTFNGTPANSDVGVVTVTVRATDTGGGWVEDQFDITVANVNDPGLVAIDNLSPRFRVTR